MDGGGGKKPENKMEDRGEEASCPAAQLSVGDAAGLHPLTESCVAGHDADHFHLCLWLFSLIHSSVDAYWMPLICILYGKLCCRTGHAAGPFHLLLWLFYPIHS